MIRYLAALLVALLLPVQGYAAACAQICAANGRAHADMAVDAQEGGGHCHEAPGEAPPPEDEGDASHPGLGKCCQAHVFVFDRAAAPAGPGNTQSPANPYVARWSSFIADEPLPPPIAFTAT